jgi:HEAT repeat protein
MSKAALASSAASRRAAWLCAIALLAPVGLLGASHPLFEDLVANLKSPNAKTRQEAAGELGKSRRREAVAPLAALVRDPEPKVRLEVVRALRELRDLSAVPALVTSLRDGDPKIREEAIGTLVELYSERDRSTPVTRFLDLFSDEYDRASVPPYTAVDPSVYSGLGTELRDDDPGIREQAALALGILNGTGQVRELVAELKDPVDDVRGAAATAIGKVGSAEDGKALVPLIGDSSTSVRNRALYAIGVLKVREAGPALRQLYEANPRREPGLRVLECLSRIGDPAQADLFRELAQDSDVERRRLAIEGLARISDAQMLPAFKKDFQREGNDELRLAYAFALTRLGDRAFLDTIVLSLPSKIYGNRCRRYILEMGKELLPDLYAYLNDPDADVRAALCDLISDLGDKDSIPRLEPLISDPSSRVADRANRAVERLKRASAQGSSQ